MCLKEHTHTLNPIGPESIIKLLLARSFWKVIIIGQTFKACSRDISFEELLIVLINSSNFI